MAVQSRGHLPRAEVAGSGTPPALVDPQVERAVARVLRGPLSTPVDVTTPFFRLGATSLTLMLAHRRLRAELDPGLAVVDLFAHPTVHDLASWITARCDDEWQTPRRRSPGNRRARRRSLRKPGTRVGAARPRT